MAKRGSLKLRWSVHSLKKGRVLKGTYGSLHEKRDEPNFLFLGLKQDKIFIPLD
jgi:hypothetical protein